MREAGCEGEVLEKKSDSERALTKVVEDVGRLRAAMGGQGMVVENRLSTGARATDSSRGRSRACRGW